MTSRKSHTPTSLLAILWVTHCWKWTCVPWRSPHHPSIRKGEDPWYSAPTTSRHYQNTAACLWFCFLVWYQQGTWGSCLAMWNMHEISGPECCYTTHTNTYTFMSLADMCIRHLHIEWYGLPHPCWLLFQSNPGMHPPHRPKKLCQIHPHPGRMVLWSWHTRSATHR